MYLKEPRDVVMAFLEEAVALEPENASFIHNRGIAKFRFHDYEGAADDLRSAIQLNPDNAGYYYDLGTVLRYLEGENEGQSLIEVFTTGIRIAEEEGAEYYEGLCYSGRGFVRTTLGDLEGAIEDYSRAIDLVPTEWRFHSEIGALYMKLGKFEDAISSFADAIDRAPTESLPYVQRSEAREKIGDRRGAREDREEADRLREAGMDS